VGQISATASPEGHPALISDGALLASLREGTAPGFLLAMTTAVVPKCDGLRGVAPISDPL